MEGQKRDGGPEEGLELDLAVHHALTDSGLLRRHLCPPITAIKVY